ncbi:putative damage-inducible protein DinB [Planifilum fimeticola]|uniref:Putative damage-inducible protein DinB n=1 Tax=Planifilum fimeticola TaxID=201975 RepID=A0A2T0LCJ6_9BACL|nr:DinB family protein [Planifilum fimeticola]PRX39676.1 putative damage-inducible protein DinB [Planifilum fimeticola]
MHHDLEPAPGMAPIVGLLYATVEDTYRRLRQRVEGMSQEELDDKGPFGDLNSTGQLIRHLAVVDLHWVYRLRGEPVPRDLQEAYGPMFDRQGKIPAVSGVPLEELLESYDRVQTWFRDVCLELTDEDLDRVVDYEDGKTATIRWGIWHIADHSRYHQAQIAWLRKWWRQGRNKG